MAQQDKQQDVVVDKGQASWSDLIKLEDYWAIWLGFAILAIGLMIYLPNEPKNLRETIAESNAIMQMEANRAPFKTIEYYKAADAKGMKATSTPLAKQIKTFQNKPHGWSTNPVDAFFMDSERANAKKAKADAKYQKAKAAEQEALAAATVAQKAAADADFGNTELNQKASDAISNWRNKKFAAGKAKKKTKAKPYNQLIWLIILCITLGIFFGIGRAAMGYSPVKFFIGFFFVFTIATLAYVAAQQGTMKGLGIGYAAWAILFGLLISNTVGTPKWVMPAVQTEYFIKTGLVLLGAEVLFSKIVAIGIPGIFVAWVVTPVVLITTFIFGQKVVKMPSKTLNIVISADMSVCGVSAAIATAAACRAKKEELTLSVGLSLVFTSIMMIVMPAFIKAVEMPYILGGAWMGGTIDATGAVAAAGAFLSQKALYVAATIKMIQNVLIGVTAFGVAIYWCTRVDCTPGRSVNAWEIWYRFPKFVLGFLAASVLFSWIYASMGADVGYAMVDHGVIRGFSKAFRGWFFCLAFVSIGLATNFRELGHYFKGGKPLILYVCGQSFNLLLTLTMAYIMFYLVFPEITAKI
ncbi:putative sulfate exporter family transporter [Halodesulfovibrio sp.]|uniref:YeiH family protein n=1 Tax=Halodesulfovibrio sp. TaxID=1912772 RepID=UPI0025F25EAF|nr:putative sulfate exporter family transporter [Halodesulfovibrio sp.]MCT4534365.1 YeiH family protein [Halodesulfovibrio sp.]